MDPRERNKLRREKIEKNRQRFRIKVETFYKEFYPDKWEVARDLLFCKYSVNFKEFNVKLIEKYGDAFKNYKVGDVKVKTAKELQAERVRQAAILNGEISEEDEEVEEEENNGLSACNNCGRSFAPDRIVKHEDICMKRAERNAAKKTNTTNVNSVVNQKDEVQEEEEEEEPTIEFTKEEQSEIEELEEQLRQLKMLKARKQQARK